MTSLWRMLLGGLTPLVVLTGLAGCSATLIDAADSGTSETYELVALNGEPVPVNHGPQPRRFGQEAVCHRITERGGLSLDRGSGRYMVHTIGRSSCDGRILSNRWTTGTYTIDGDVIRLDLGRGPDLEGWMREDTVEVEDTWTYTYTRRAGELTSTPAYGRYQLAEVRGEALPVDLGPLVTPGGAPTCTTEVGEGSLSVEQEENGTATFRLRYVLRDSCTNELLYEVEEMGAVEQTGVSLGFHAELGVNRVKLFAGVVDANELIVFREYNYTFRR